MTKLAHSYSSTKDFESCPHKYNEVKRLKHFKGKTHPAAERGKLIHKKFEEALSHDIDVGQDYQWALSYVRQFTGLKVPERQLAIDYEFQPCAWFGDNVFYRAVLDVMIINGDHLICIDYKTGKRRYDPRQGREQALLAWLHLPHIHTAEAHFLWLDADHAPDVERYDRHKDGESMIEALLEAPSDIETCAEEDKWERRPSGLCKFCPVVSCPHHSD